MADHKLSVISPDEVRQSVIIQAPPKGKLAFQGDGPDRLLCGNCGAPLAVGVVGGELVGVFVQCPDCQALNHTNQ
jgi:hypothetical protein